MSAAARGAGRAAGQATSRRSRATFYHTDGERPQRSGPPQRGQRASAREATRPQEGHGTARTRPRNSAVRYTTVNTVITARTVSSAITCHP